jgi:hypothetical protein
MPPPCPVSPVHGGGVDVFTRVTATHRAANDQYAKGGLESTSMVDSRVRTILSTAPLSSSVYRGEPCL